MIFLVLKCLDNSGYICCIPENWAINSKGAKYVMSFEAETVEKGFEIFNVFNSEPELFSMSMGEMALEIRKLRQGIRKHRDSEGHNLCWYVPELWGLLPEKTDPVPPVPEKEEFLRCCKEYRESLDK